MTVKKPDISDLVLQVCTHKLEADVSLLDVPNELLPGRAALKNAAFHQFEAGLAALRSVIGQYTMGIFVSGPGAKAFSEVAEDEGPALVLDVSEMYRKVAEAWYPTVRIDKVFALDCLIPFIGATNNLLGPLGVRQIASPDFGGFFGRPVTCLEDAVAVTRDILRKTVADDLNGLYLNNALAVRAVEAEWDLAVVPVVLLNATPDEEKVLLTDLFYGHNIAYTAQNPNVEKNEVLITFKHARTKYTALTQQKPQLVIQS